MTSNTKKEKGSDEFYVGGSKEDLEMRFNEFIKPAIDELKRRTPIEDIVSYTAYIREAFLEGRRCGIDSCITEVKRHKGIE